MFNPCCFRQFYADFASVGKACADHNSNPSCLGQFVNGFHSAKHRRVSVTSKAIVTTPPMISAVMVSHFRHGLRRMGRRMSEQVGCIVFCAVLCCVVAFAVSPRGDFVPCLGLISGSCVHASQKGADHVFSVTLGNVTVPDWSCDSAVLICHQVDTYAAVSL